MPIYMDRHDLTGFNPAQVAEAHRMDMEVQHQYGVKFMTYWFDDDRKSGFCLIDAPDADAAIRLHGDTHGNIPKDIIEVDLSAVEAFLGRVTDPKNEAVEQAALVDAAFRTVMFTDIVGLHCHDGPFGRPTVDRNGARA